LVSFPAAALRAGNKVWVVRDSKLHILPVRIAGRTDSIAGRSLSGISDRLSENAFVGNGGGWLLALVENEGLQTGDRIITSPLMAPYEGMELQDQGAAPRASTASDASAESSSGGSSVPVDGNGSSS
ncbi:MAG: hypothetical protein KDA83_17820, partial [Planctomycetales bacterium]|nr:hypothetical protein [Planctomycetales bacterium]